jgi:SAM-dependent methyltransferase
MRAEMYRVHQEFQDSHWWFTARRDIVLSLLRRAIRRARMQLPLRIVDIGCGAAGMVPHVRELGYAIGVDPSPELVEFARQNGIPARLGSLPDDVSRSGEDPFDVVLLLDVLEHIDDDLAALRGLRAVLRPGGVLLLTVPAFQFLWSKHDVVNEHRRRYTRPALAQRLRQAGFAIEKISYFNTVLFLPIAAVRLIGRLFRGRQPVPDMAAVREPFNRILHRLFALERHALAAVSLPFGVSLIALAHVPAAADANS